MLVHFEFTDIFQIAKVQIMKVMCLPQEGEGKHYFYYYCLVFSKIIHTVFEYEHVLKIAIELCDI